MVPSRWMKTNLSRGWVMVAAAAAGISGGCYSYFFQKPRNVYKFEQNLVGKTYIVVGATSGIGNETAKELAKRKAKVIMACRDHKKCIMNRRNLVINTKNMDIYCRNLNLEDFDSVRNFVLKLDTGKGNIEQVDGIIYSAATTESVRKTNKQHIERTFATNYLGPFLLTSLLYDRLMKQSKPVRLIFLNPAELTLDELNFNDLNSTDLKKWLNTPEKAKKDAFYRSKLALSLFVKSLSEKVKDTNLRVIMVDPGATNTDLIRRLEGAEGRFFLVRWCKALKRSISGLVSMQSANKAVYPVLYALADEKLENVNGVFIGSDRSELPWHPLASNKELLEKLWLTSAKWTETSTQLKRLKEELRKSKTEEPDLIQKLRSGMGWFSWLW